MFEFIQEQNIKTYHISFVVIIICFLSGLVRAEVPRFNNDSISSEVGLYYGVHRKNLMRFISRCNGELSIVKEQNNYFYKCLSENKIVSRKNRTKKTSTFLSKITYFKFYKDNLEIALYLDGVPHYELLNIKTLLRSQIDDYIIFSSRYCANKKVNYCYRKKIDERYSYIGYNIGCGLNGYESIFAIENFCQSIESRKLSSFCKSKDYSIMINDKIKSLAKSQTNQESSSCYYINSPLLYLRKKLL